VTRPLDVTEVSVHCDAKHKPNCASSELARQVVAAVVTYDVTPGLSVRPRLQSCDLRHIHTYRTTPKHPLKSCRLVYPHLRARVRTRSEYVLTICPLCWHKELGMSDAILVRDWNVDDFHRHVLELETRGYVARRETYRITPETNPETGEVIHLYVIEMFLSQCA
jgi:hypothetical protein